MYNTFNAKSSYNQIVIQSEGLNATSNNDVKKESGFIKKENVASDGNQQHKCGGNRFIFSNFNIDSLLGKSSNDSVTGESGYSSNGSSPNPTKSINSVSSPKNGEFDLKAKNTAKITREENAFSQSLKKVSIVNQETITNKVNSSKVESFKKGIVENNGKQPSQCSFLSKRGLDHKNIFNPFYTFSEVVNREGPQSFQQQVLAYQKFLSIYEQQQRMATIQQHLQLRRVHPMFAASTILPQINNLNSQRFIPGSIGYSNLNSATSQNNPNLAWWASHFSSPSSCCHTEAQSVCEKTQHFQGRSKAQQVIKKKLSPLSSNLECAHSRFV